ncbi:MAG: hypothetical protein AAGA25_03765 [Planctomycetota bacterium]
MSQQTPSTNQPSAWLGVLGFVMVCGFGGLAVLDTATGSSTAQPTEEAVVRSDDASVETSTDIQPIPLYASETGAHQPTQAKPGAPGPEGTSLFESN